jgi:hypothetical protein
MIYIEDTVVEAAKLFVVVKYRTTRQAKPNHRQDSMFSSFAPAFLFFFRYSTTTKVPTWLTIANAKLNHEQTST